MTGKKYKAYEAAETGPCRVLFCHLTDFATYQGKPTNRYELTVAFDANSESTKALQAKCLEVAHEGFGTTSGVKSFGLKKPTDAQIEKYPNTYKDKLVATFVTYEQPKCVAHDTSPILVGNIGYGDIVNCHIGVAAYEDSQHGKRLKLWLNGVQQLGKGSGTKGSVEFKPMPSVQVEPTEEQTNGAQPSPLSFETDELPW